MAKLFKRVFLILLIIFICSPLVLVLFVSDRHVYKFGGLLEDYIPFFRPEYSKYLILGQSSLDIPDSMRGNFFLRGQNYSLHFPKGFEMAVYANAGIGKAGMMAWSKEGDLYIANEDSGQILILQDQTQDGFSDEIIVFASGLNSPFGLAFYEDWLYVTETNQVSRHKDETGDLVADLSEVVLPELVRGHEDGKKGLIFGSDKKLYVSLPAVCNVCQEGRDNSGMIKRYNPDGSGEEVFATGLYRSLGLFLSLIHI